VKDALGTFFTSGF